MCNGNVNLGGQMQQRPGLYLLVHQQQQQQQQTATDANADLQPRRGAFTRRLRAFLQLQKKKKKNVAKGLFLPQIRPQIHKD